MIMSGSALVTNSAFAIKPTHSAIPVANLATVFETSKNLRSNAAAMLANFVVHMSSAGCPRQCAHSEDGAPAYEMKDKRAESKAAKQQRANGCDEEAFENKRSHAPT